MKTRLDKPQYKLFSLGLLAAAALLMFAPGIFGSKILFGGDSETLLFPFSQFIRDSLAAGEWPLWMPSVYGGMPGLASANLNFLYPSELLMHSMGLPLAKALALDSALHCWLAGAGMLLFLGRQNIHGGAALLGAAIFAWSGSLISILYAGHVNNLKAIALIPWIFWALDKGLREKSFSGYAAAGIAFALQILAIGMQIYAYTIIAAFAYALWYCVRVDKNATKQAAFGLSLMLLVSVLISAPQLFPSLEYKAYSLRENFSYDSFVSWSFEPEEALAWLVPGFFGWRFPTYWGDWPFSLTTEYFGILPWLLAAAAVAAALKTKNHTVWFFVVLALFSFLAALGKYTPLHRLFYALPIYSGFRSWVRFLCLFTFSLSVLAAFGLQAWQDQSSKKIRLWLIAAAGLILLIIAAAFIGAAASASGAAVKMQSQGIGAAAIQSLAQSSALRSLALTAGFTAVLLLGLRWIALPRVVLALPLLLLSLHWLDMGEVRNRYVEWRNPQEFFKKPAALNLLPEPHPLERWRILDLPGTFRQNQVMLHHYDSLLGYHGLPPASAQKIQDALAQRQDVWFDLMGVKYLVGRQALNAPWWKPLGEVHGIYAVENTRALPQFYLAPESRQVANTGDALKQMAGPEWNPAQTAWVVQGQDIPPVQRPGSLQIEENRYSSARLKLELAQEQFLVFAQNYFPGWSASLNGQEIRLYEAQGGLMGVYLPQGQHHLEFQYHSRWLLASLIAMFFGLILCGWIFYRERTGV